MYPVLKVEIMIFRGIVHSKKSSYTPQKNPKNPKKIPKNKDFFWGFKIRLAYLGVSISSNSVFKYLFIYKILVHFFGCTPKKFSKNPKNPKKFKDFFFWGFKIRLAYLGVNNSSNSVFKYFFIYEILVHQKTISKNPKKFKVFFLKI